MPWATPYTPIPGKKFKKLRISGFRFWNCFYDCPARVSSPKSSGELSGMFLANIQRCSGRTKSSWWSGANHSSWEENSGAAERRRVRPCMWVHVLQMTSQKREMLDNHFWEFRVGLDHRHRFGNVVWDIHGLWALRSKSGIISSVQYHHKSIA